jgi:hypothetical protein
MQTSSSTGQINWLAQEVSHSVTRGSSAHPDDLCGLRLACSAAADGTHACDYLLACDMEMVPIPVSRARCVAINTNMC